MIRKLFVTGGAGFIGAAFIRLALERWPDAEIINFDALTYAGNPDNLAGLDARRHRFIRGDITDREAVRAALPEETDALFNFAAESHVDRSIESADDFLRTNILGTQVLLDAARERGARRFLQVSTDEVMGSLPEDAAAFFTEASPYEPNRPYAASTAAAEHLVRGGVYNIGARNERRNLEVVESILDALGKPASLIRFVKDRPGHDRRYALDPAKAERELGWQPQETWESGLRKTIQWYADNTEWIARVRNGAYREFYARQYGAEVGAR